MSKPVFPLNPVHGQVYIDQNNVEWVYDIAPRAWFWIGPVLTFPVAQSGDNCK